MANKLAEAFVEVGTKLSPLKSGLAKAKGMVQSAAGKMKEMGAVAGQAFAVAFGAAMAGGIGLIKFASDAEEMNSKFKAVWGDMSDDVAAWADDYAKHVGRSKNATRGFVSELGDLFQPLGFSREQAAGLSKQVAALGIDLASFNSASGMTDADAIERLNAGLLGSHEVLKKFGVIINESILKQELMKMGFEKGTVGVTEQAKMLARWQIVMRSTTAAHGDAAKTAGSTANSWKAFVGELKDYAAELGTSLLPLANEVIAVLRDTIPAIQGVINSWTQMGSTTPGIFSSMLGWIKQVISVLANWDLVTQEMGIKWARFITNSAERVSWFGKQVGIFLGWLFDNWKGIFVTIWNFTKSVFTNLVSNLRSIFKELWDWVQSGFTDSIDIDWQPLMKGFESAVKDSPAFTKFVPTSFDSQLNEVAKKWEKRMADAATKTKQAGADVTDVLNQDLGIDAKQFSKDAAADSKKGTGNKFVGILEAWKNAQQSVLDKDKLPKEQLKVQKAMLAEQKKQTRIMDREPALALA